MKTYTRLDRLSALLDGLAPRITVDGSHSPELARPELLLYLVTNQPLELIWGVSSPQWIPANSVVIVPANRPHSLAQEAGTQSPVCLKVHLQGPVAPLLLHEFDQPMVIALDQAEPALRYAVELTMAEISAPRCGHFALLERAGDILFIGLLRNLVAQPQKSSGLFRGLSEPRIASALVAMHETPQSPWSLEGLAAQAGMSRTAFATQFKAAMQITPGKYLGQLRLQIAQRAVKAGKGLKAAARESGFTNTSALSRALSMRCQRPIQQHEIRH